MALVGKNIESLKPYQAGKPIEELERELGITGSIKLASNENPLGAGELALAAIHEHAAQAHIYPDAGAYNLRAAVASHFDVPPDEVITANGSNELLTMLARTFGPGGNAVISQYGFVAYRIVLQAAGIPLTEVPTRAGFVQDLDAIAAACDANTKLVYLANPNNPTGVYANGAELRAFLAAVPEHVIVVLDEAYVEYAQADDYESALAMRDVRDLLVVCRTFSKCYGLAGLRVGFGVAPPSLIDYMNRIREPFNTSLIAQAAAAAALRDTDHIRRSVEVNEAARAVLTEGCAALGLETIPSQTNFLLVRTPRPGVEVYDAMLREGVIVRPLVPYALHDWVRISLGTPEQMQRCLDALKKTLV